MMRVTSALVFGLLVSLVGCSTTQKAPIVDGRGNIEHLSGPPEIMVFIPTEETMPYNFVVENNPNHRPYIYSSPQYRRNLCASMDRTDLAYLSMKTIFDESRYVKSMEKVFFASPEYNKWKTRAHNNEYENSNLLAKTTMDRLKNEEAKRIISSVMSQLENYINDIISTQIFVAILRYDYFYVGIRECRGINDLTDEAVRYIDRLYDL